MHVRKRLATSITRPRLVVYRSNVHIYVQVIDDLKAKTITGCSTLTPAILNRVKEAKGGIAKAKIVGEQIAVLAKAKGIIQVSFDRNGRKYHGRVKALAEGARAGGLEF
jgi:large subunit ribosomal protein L18